MNIIETIDKGMFLPQIEKSVNSSWFSSDSEELYEENLKLQPEDWYYRTNQVKYNLNHDGYRTQEFDQVDWENSIVMFGCSTVFGVGVTEEHTIGYNLEKILNIPVINMGVCGSSSMFSLHNSVILKENYPTPKGIIIGWTSPYRIPYYKNNRVIHCGFWNKDTENLVQSWCKHIINPTVNLKLTAKLFKEMWKDETEYYEFSIFESSANILKCDFMEQIDSARDLKPVPKHNTYCGHFGRKTNKRIAQKIANKMFDNKRNV